MNRLAGDKGAAAVEFALLFPVFMAMVLGMITAGASFERWIGITQGAREGARVGATMSLPASNPTGTGTIDTWLPLIYDSSVRASGLDATNRGFAACVALSEDGTTFTKYSAVGAAPPAKTVGSPCYTDGQTGPRVQVALQRNTFWDWFLGNRDLTVKGQSTTRWEHGTP